MSKTNNIESTMVIDYLCAIADQLNTPVVVHANGYNKVYMVAEDLEIWLHINTKTRTIELLDNKGLVVNDFHYGDNFHMFAVHVLTTLVIGLDQLAYN